MTNNQENNPKTIKEVKEYVDNNYLLGMLEQEYRELCENQMQLEYLHTVNGQNMYGKEKADMFISTLETEIERKQGRVEFLEQKLQESGEPSPYYQDKEE